MGLRTLYLLLAWEAISEGQDLKADCYCERLTATGASSLTPKPSFSLSQIQLATPFARRLAALEPFLRAVLRTT